MKLVMAQVNSTVGAFEQNASKIRDVLQRSQGADLVVFPEAVTCGYPPQDLLGYRRFAERAESVVQSLLAIKGAPPCLIGSVEVNPGSGRPYLNVALWLENGAIKHRYVKRLLPTYDVFDEDRFFEPGRAPLIVEHAKLRISVTICEDIWNELGDTSLINRYSQFPAKDSQGVDLLINLSASPYETSKAESKRGKLSQLCTKYDYAMAYVNGSGANDSLIFDGRSYFISKTGDVQIEGKAFQEDEVLVDTDQVQSRKEPAHFDRVADLYDALVSGIQDYCRKQGFSDVVLGLSGGIDSALVACLAADALGSERCHTFLLPSRYTSEASNRDALQQCITMQNPVHILAIEHMFTATLKTLEKTFEGLEPDVTEENIQSRIRGLLLMAAANKFGWLLLATGNKSELATGYCTLYGDMNGGLAPIADVFKTDVYALAREANRRRSRIPENVFIRPPSAELRQHQTDQDQLPPYELLDRALKLLIEDEEWILGRSDLGLSQEQLQQIVGWVERNEFKRFQMPLGLKISRKAFGLGRRVPIVSRFLTERNMPV